MTSLLIRVDTIVNTNVKGSKVFGLAFVKVAGVTDVFTQEEVRAFVLPKLSDPTLTGSAIVQLDNVGSGGESTNHSGRGDERFTGVLTKVFSNGIVDDTVTTNTADVTGAAGVDVYFLTVDGINETAVNTGIGILYETLPGILNWRNYQDVVGYKHRLTNPIDLTIGTGVTMGPNGEMVFDGTADSYILMNNDTTLDLRSYDISFEFKQISRTSTVDVGMVSRGRWYTFGTQIQANRLELNMYKSSISSEESRNSFPLPDGDDTEWVYAHAVYDNTTQSAALYISSSGNSYIHRTMTNNIPSGSENIPFIVGAEMAEGVTYKGDPDPAQFSRFFTGSIRNLIIQEFTALPAAGTVPSL